MRPFSGDATVAWHTPKHDPEAQRSVDVSIHVRKVQLQPAFSQTPQYLAAMHALRSSMMQYYQVHFLILLSSSVTTRQSKDTFIASISYMHQTSANTARCLSIDIERH